MISAELRKIFDLGIIEMMTIFNCRSVRILRFGPGLWVFNLRRVASDRTDRLIEAARSTILRYALRTKTVAKLLELNHV